MRMYSKLFASILDSSVWLEPLPTRVVWLTLLAAKNQDGYARFAAMENLAARARVSVEDCERAVATLEAPDRKSSNPDHEGRRIERVPGGWQVLNAKLYDDMVRQEDERRATRERVRRHRERKRQYPSDAHQEESVESAPTEAEAEAQTSDEGRLIHALPSGAVRAAWVAELAAARNGLHGPPLSEEQVARACRDFVGNGHMARKPTLRHFRAFLKDAGRPASASSTKLDRGLVGLTAFVERGKNGQS